MPRSRWILLSIIAGMFGVTGCTARPAIMPSASSIISASVTNSDGLEVNPRSLYSNGIPPVVQTVPGRPNTLGTVRALVMPVSISDHEAAFMPSWSDSTIAARVIGSPDAPSAPEFAPARLLSLASDGLFRLDASVFPVLVTGGLFTQTEKSVPPDSLLSDEDLLADLAAKVVGHWSQRVNLAQFDNDGPDGLPMSRDDDGVLDFVIIPVEADSGSFLPHRHIQLRRLTVPVGPRGESRLRVTDAFLLPLPRGAALPSVDRGPLELVLSAMGVDLDRMFLPPGIAALADVPLTTVARVQLGWRSAGTIGRSGVYPIEHGQVLAVPLVDVDARRGHWLVESMAEGILLTRTVRLDGGSAPIIVETRWVARGDDSARIPLTRDHGIRGPRFRINWDQRGSGAFVTASLTQKAAAEDLLAEERGL